MELIKLTLPEFRKIAKLVYDKTGIDLPESKLTLLSNRLRKRLRELKLDTYQQYYDLLCHPKQYDEEMPHFLSAVTTNETYFFRNVGLWQFVRETWLPEILERKKNNKCPSIHVWSAASSSGEEAYTAAICLREGIRNFSKWKVSIVASDISQRVLDHAQKGEYNDYAVSRTDKAILKKWFQPRDDLYCLKPEIKDLVKFQFHNLRDPFPRGQFDLIFLRNVLMYFDLEMKKKVLATVRDALTKGGYLVVGDVDPIRNTPGLSEILNFETKGPNLYYKPLVAPKPELASIKD